MAFFPKCDVCKQQFNFGGPVPSLLPCLHAACESCVSSASDKQEINCSVCTKTFKSDERDFPKDNIRQREIFEFTVKNCPSKITCTNDDDGNQAVSWCQECEVFLCEHCQNKHEDLKATKRHSVQEVGETWDRAQEQDEFCSIHKKYVIDQYDYDCKVLICSRCYREDHSQHECEDLTEASDRARTSLSTDKVNLSDMKDKMRGCARNLKQEKKTATGTHADMKEKVSHTFNALGTTVDQRKKEVAMTLQTTADVIRSELEEKLTESNATQIKCTAVVEYIEKCLLYASKSDLLTLKSTLDEITRTCLTADQPLKHEAPKLLFKTEGLDELKCAISDFGNVRTSEDSQLLKKWVPMDTTKQTDTDHLKTESESLTNQLLKKVRRLESELDEVKSEVEVLKITKEDCISRLQTTLKKLGSSADIFVISLEIQGSAITVLLCPQLLFDNGKLNSSDVRLTFAGELVHGKLDTATETGTMLKKYSGTSSRTCLERLNSPQYWEVKAPVRLINRLQSNWLVLEIGVCIEGDRDKSDFIAEQNSSYSFNVSHCTTHTGICRQVWKEGNWVGCTQHTLNNLERSSEVLHFGVLYDDVSCKIAFLDIGKLEMLAKLDSIKDKSPLWPMFGVYNSQYADVSMSLVSGNDIVFTEKKLKLIREAIHEYR